METWTDPFWLVETWTEPLKPTIFSHRGRRETPLSWLHEGHQQGQWREDGMATILNLAVSA